MSESNERLDFIVDMLIPAMNGTRQRRKFIENEWLLNYRAYQGWPSQNYQLVLPDNAIHYFIPHARRAVERNVKRATKLLMPNMDWHQTLPFDGRSHENAEAVHNVMRYIYQKKLPTKRNISSGMRSLQLYNFTAIHTSAMIYNKEVWPYQRTVDPFNFYVFPDTASSCEEALLIFEDSIIPYQVYMSYVDRDNESKSLFKYIDSDDLQTPEWPYHLVERIAYRGLSNPSDFVQGTGNTRTLREEDIQSVRNQTNESLAKQSKAFVALSKVYFRLSSKWYYTVLCTNISGGGSNTYNTKVVRLDDDVENYPLYRWTNTRPLPGELYTNSNMDDIRVLQNITNNSLSQLESNRSINAEPPLAIDANGISRMEQKTFGNRKVWLFDGDPNQIVKALEIRDTTDNNLKALQVYKGLIDQNSGGGLPEGQPGRNMPRAGFAANTLLNMSLTDTEDEADTFEQEVLTPGLGDVYHIILEYVPNSQLIKIPNKNPSLVKAYKKKDLYGDYSFTWLGSLGFQDTQVRADKFMQFAQMLLNPQVFPLLQQQLAQEQKKIDLAGMFKTIYSYGMGERGLGDLIIPMTQQEIQAANQPSPQQQQAQQKQQMEQQKLQGQMQLKQQEGQLKGQETQQKMQHDQMKFGLEIQKQKADLQKQQAEHHLDLEGKQADLEFQRQSLGHKLLLSTMSTMNGGQNNNGKQQEQK